MQTPSSFSIPTPDLPSLDDSLILGLLAQQTSTRADNADILAYFEKHADLASRSEFCRTSYKQIYTQLYVGERMAGFIRHDQYLELWEGNYLTKSAQSNLTWDAVSDKIAALIERGQLLVPIRTTAPKPELEQLRKEIAPYLEQDEDVLSYALFPEVSKKFFEYRKAKKYGLDGENADKNLGVHSI